VLLLIYVMWFRYVIVSLLDLWWGGRWLGCVGCCIIVILIYNMGIFNFTFSLVGRGVLRFREG